MKKYLINLYSNADEFNMRRSLHDNSNRFFTIKLFNDKQFLEYSGTLYVEFSFEIKDNEIKSEISSLLDSKYCQIGSYQIIEN